MIAASLFEFCKERGLLKSQGLRLARCGRIAGAFQELAGRRWFVCSPGELLSPLGKRTTWRDRIGGQP